METSSWVDRCEPARHHSIMIIQTGQSRPWAGDHGPVGFPREESKPRPQVHIGLTFWGSHDRIQARSFIIASEIPTFPIGKIVVKTWMVRLCEHSLKFRSTTIFERRTRNRTSERL
jgi:hypothetical protein